ncbi:helix-turn-helix domain-containing protein [Methanocalculus sp.]|uniref:AlbA family DNA-binding domain-containing protein n=1 Tax=Methanocalculus sp. TaxID=2004547 RepID=UPI00262475DA|nr:ATP-binding protein [Methanocalculus sp.]MDG6250511.1 ATP-binding protein [Methanocalculus sp.]
MIESQNIEFKESWKDEYLKTLCAFANTNGGITAMDYASIVPEVSEKTRYRDLLDLVHRGLLEAFGAKKGRKYVLTRPRPGKA